MKKITTFLTIVFLTSLTWQMNAQNGGDTCAMAVAVTDGPVTGTLITQNTLGGQGDVITTRDAAWFVYTATADGTITVDSCLGGTDTRLWIFNDCADAGAAANDDDTCPFMTDGSGDTFASRVEDFPVVTGEDYFIEWDDTWSMTAFNWNITFTPAPACPDVTNITYVINQDGSAFADWDDVAGAVGYNAEIQLQGVAQGTPSPIIANSPVASEQPIPTGVLTEGVAYTAYVQSNCGSGVLGAFTSLDFTFIIPGPTSTCELAEVITEGIYTAQIIDAIPPPNPVMANDFVWYSYTPAMDGLITISSCFVGDIITTDTRVFVFEGPCDALVPVANDDDGCDAPDGLSSLITDQAVVGGTEYFIRWDDRWSSAEFTWELSFSPPLAIPDNDACADAITVTCDTTIAGTTIGATQVDQQLDECGTTAGAPGVWYTFENTLDAGSEVIFSLCNGATTFDSKIQVFSGSCDALVCVDGNDDFCGLQSEIAITTDDTVTTYYVYVFGFGTDQGDFELSISCVAAPVDCEAPENLAVSDILVATAVFTWDESPVFAEGYVLGVFDAGADPLVDNPVYLSALLPQGTLTDTATGLTADTPYDAYIISICDTGNAVFDISDVVTFNTILNTNRFETESFTMFPNPADGFVTFKANVSMDTVEVYNLLGQVVLNKTANATDFTLDVSNLQSGTYFVRATANGVTTTQKLIKR